MPRRLTDAALDLWYVSRHARLTQYIQHQASGVAVACQGRLVDFVPTDEDQKLVAIAFFRPRAAPFYRLPTGIAEVVSKPRQGEVIIIVTAGECETWDKISNELLPPSLRANLASEPLWTWA